MVGAVRFELTTFCTPSKRATSLRYAPKKAVRNQMGFLLNWSERYHVVGGAVNWHLSQAVTSGRVRKIAQTPDAEVLYPGDGGKPAVHGNDGAGHEAGAIGNQPQGGTHHFLRRG